MIIKHFSLAQIEAIFGTEWKADALKGFEWTKGGVFAGKSQKLKTVTASECLPSSHPARTRELMHLFQSSRGWRSRTASTR